MGNFRFFNQRCIEFPAMDIIGAEVLEKMNENPKEAGKFSRFFEEKGFYIILFLCVAAIGIAGYVLFIAPAAADETADTTDKVLDAFPNGNSGDSGASAPSVSIPDNTVPDGTIIPSAFDDPETPEDGDSVETVKPQDDATAPVTEMSEEDAVEASKTTSEKKQTENKETKDSKDTQSQQPQKTEDSAKDSAPTFFVKPVSGDIIRDFCVTELLYDRTMGDWRTHNGADFSATTGEAVVAIADGTVREVYRNEFYGTCVVIAHGGGMESRYYGLAEQATIAAGDSVKAGDTIGSVGTGSHFESLEPVHLHMELTIDGKYVNPGEYIA